MFKFPVAILAMLLLLSFHVNIAYAQESDASTNSTIQSGGPKTTETKAKSDTNQISKLEKDLDSSFAFLKAQVLSELPENATKGLITIRWSANVRKIVTIMDTNTQKYSDTDSLFTLYSKGRSNIQYTKSGMKKNDTMTITPKIIESPKVKTKPSNTITEKTEAK